MQKSGLADAVSGSPSLRSYRSRMPAFSTPPVEGSPQTSPAGRGTVVYLICSCLHEVFPQPSLL